VKDRRNLSILLDMFGFLLEPTVEMWRFLVSLLHFLYSPFFFTKFCSFTKLKFENFSISKNDLICAEAAKLLWYYTGVAIHDLKL